MANNKYNMQPYQYNNYAPTVYPSQPQKKMVYPGSPPGVTPGMAFAPGVRFEQGPPTTTYIGYTPAFLKTQIGKRVEAQFIIGTDLYVDKSGTLIDVGIDYIIIRETNSNNRVLCDMYSLKFVTFYD